MTVASGSASTPTLTDVERLVRSDVGGTLILSVYLDLDRTAHEVAGKRLREAWDGVRALLRLRLHR